MGLLGGIGQPAGDRVGGLLGAVKGKAQLALVTGLGGHFGKIKALARNTGRGARLEPAQLQPQLFQTGGQIVGCVHSIGAHVPYHLAGEGLGPQKGTGCKDNGFTVVTTAAHHAYTADAALFIGEQFPAFALGQVQIGTLLQNLAHIGPIAHPVGLGTGGVDCRAFAPVEHPELQAGGVGRTGHFAAQCVDFPHQLPLCRAADGGVAGQIADALQRGAQAEGGAAQSCGGKSGLDSGVSRANHYDIILSGEKVQHG